MTLSFGSGKAKVRYVCPVHNEVVLYEDEEDEGSISKSPKIDMLSKIDINILAPIKVCIKCNNKPYPRRKCVKL
jgi:hypothetical protein